MLTLSFFHINFLRELESLSKRVIYVCLPLHLGKDFPVILFSVCLGDLLAMENLMERLSSPRRFSATFPLLPGWQVFMAPLSITKFQSYNHKCKSVFVNRNKLNTIVLHKYDCNSIPLKNWSHVTHDTTGVLRYTEETRPDPGNSDSYWPSLPCSYCFPFSLSLSLTSDTSPLSSHLQISVSTVHSNHFHRTVPLALGLLSRIPRNEGPRMCERDSQPVSSPAVYQVEGSSTCFGPRAGRRITTRWRRW